MRNVCFLLNILYKTEILVAFHRVRNNTQVIRFGLYHCRTFSRKPPICRNLHRVQQWCSRLCLFSSGIAAATLAFMRMPGMLGIYSGPSAFLARSFLVASFPTPLPSPLKVLVSIGEWYCAANILFHCYLTIYFFSTRSWTKILMNARQTVYCRASSSGIVSVLVLTQFPIQAFQQKFLVAQPRPQLCWLFFFFMHFRILLLFDWYNKLISRV